MAWLTHNWEMSAIADTLDFVLDLGPMVRRHIYQLNGIAVPVIKGLFCLTKYQTIFPQYLIWFYIPFLIVTMLNLSTAILSR